MKKLISIPFLLCLTLLGGCGAQDNSIQPDDNETTPEIEENVPEIIDPNINAEAEELPKNEKVEVIDESIYSYSDFKRSDFEQLPYLSLGEIMGVSKDGVEVGTVSLVDYDVIEDSKGTGRKGVVFFFQETNTGTSTLELGMTMPDWLVQTRVFYNNIYLDEMSYNAGVNQIIAYPDYGEIKLCDSAATLKPGDSRTCYQFYSYVNTGEYLINQSTDLSDGDSWSSYLITVEEN